MRKFCPISVRLVRPAVAFESKAKIEGGGERERLEVTRVFRRREREREKAEGKGMAKRGASFRVVLLLPGERRGRTNERTDTH